jgi:hypothetical protein
MEFPKEEPKCSCKLGEPYNNLCCKVHGSIPKEESKQLFTDYPIIELGDEEFKEAPIRECELLSFDDDDNKYCYVKVGGIEKEIKRCYIYPQKGRCGDVNCVSIKEIKELLKEEPKQDALNHFLSTSNVIVKDPQKWDFNKQETLEEALSEHIKDIKYPTLIQCAEFGAKWQKERSYSEEDMHNLMDEYQNWLFNTNTVVLTFREWFEQFKKK